MWIVRSCVRVPCRRVADRKDLMALQTPADPLAHTASFVLRAGPLVRLRLPPHRWLDVAAPHTFPHRLLDRLNDRKPITRRELFPLLSLVRRHVDLNVVSALASRR